MVEHIYDSSADLDLILIKDKWTHDISSNPNNQSAFHAWDNGQNFRKLRAVEAKQGGGGWVIAVENRHFGNSDWQVMEVDADGYVNWDNAYWGDIKSKEHLFEVTGSLLSGNLNVDGSIGVNTSLLSPSAVDANGISLDTDGASVLVDTDDYAYIKTTNNDSTAEIIPITDEWGGSMRFNHSWTDGNWSDSNLATHAQSYQVNGNLAGYKLLVKQTSTSGSTTEISYHVHTLNLDGVIEWDSAEWNVDPVAQESIIFNQDVNGDGVEGFNSAALVTVDTDDDSQLPDDPESVFLKKNSESGAIYVIDNNVVIGERVELDDRQLERYETSGNGESYSSSVYAVERFEYDIDDLDSNNASCHYLIAIKNTDTYNAQTVNAWDIIPVLDTGEVIWDLASFTESIAGYEHLFGQNLDEDVAVGLNESELNAVTTDRVTDGVQMHTSNDGAIYLSDSEVNGGDKFALKDEFGGIPTISVNETWSDGSFQIYPYASIKKNRWSWSQFVLLPL